MSRVTQMNKREPLLFPRSPNKGTTESRHTYERVTAHIRMSHVTQMYEREPLLFPRSPKKVISFAEYRRFYRALLQKSPIILRSLLIVATPYGLNHFTLVTESRHMYVSVLDYFVHVSESLCCPHGVCVCVRERVCVYVCVYVYVSVSVYMWVRVYAAPTVCL